MTSQNIIAANWASNFFRAFLLDSEGNVLDGIQNDHGILSLDRDGIINVLEQARNSLDSEAEVYLAGMIGSNMGWVTAPYAQCPVEKKALLKDAVKTSIGSVPVTIFPGLGTKGTGRGPDIMRGEEAELFGLMEVMPSLLRGTKFAVLSGRHTKWVKLVDGKIVDFFTSMSGELFDNLQEKSLLTSVMNSKVEFGAAFSKGVLAGRAAGTGIGRLLFGVRAQVVSENLPVDAAASYAKGLLLGAEIADAIDCFPELAVETSLAVIGKEPTCSAYQAACALFAMDTETVLAEDVVTKGFLAIHQMKVNGDSEPIVAAKHKSMVGESLFEIEASGEVCWVDPVSHSVMCYNEEDNATRRVKLDKQLFSINPHPNGTFIGVSETAFYKVDLASGACTLIAEADLGFDDCRFNDSAIDSCGRVWAGTMSTALRPGRGSVFVLDVNGDVRQIETGFGVPNGMGWSVAEDTFFMIDTLNRTLLAFDYDLENGEISSPRVVTDFWDISGKPDGLTIDVEDQIWVGMWAGGCVVRIDPVLGAISQKINLPAKNPTSCVFKKDAPKRVYVGTSRARHSEADIVKYPASGSLFYIDI